MLPRFVELITADARLYADVQLRLAFWTALVPGPNEQWVFCFALSLTGLPLRSDAVHPWSVRLLLGTLGMDSVSRIADSAADGAQAWRRGVHVQ